MNFVIVPYRASAISRTWRLIGNAIDPFLSFASFNPVGRELATPMS